MKSYLDLTENIFHDKMVSMSYLDEQERNFIRLGRGMFGQPGLKTLSPEEKAEIARSEADEKIRVARETQQIKDASEIAKNNLQIELKRMEIEAAREERIANSAAKTFLGKTTQGTVEALGKALSYSREGFFRFVKKRPITTAVIAGAIVSDQLAASQFSTPARIPQLVKFIGSNVGKFFLDVTGISEIRITISVLRGLLTYVAIFVAAGLTIYAAFKLIKFLIDLGEAKANNIIRRIELSADDPDQLQAILSRELNVDPSKLKRSRR
jgi:hypothetical protein